MKRFIAVSAVAAGLAFGLASPASADEVKCGTPAVTGIETYVITPGSPAVPGKDAYDEVVFDHWQRWSWVGGPHRSDSPPAFPSDNWQANVEGDPHGQGVEGAYFRSHGNSGNGDWFYLEAVTKTVHHEAVPEIPAGEPVIGERTVVLTPAGPPCPLPKPDPIVGKPKPKPVEPPAPIEVVKKPVVAKPVVKTVEKTVKTVTVQKTAQAKTVNAAPVVNEQPQELAHTGQNLNLALLGGGMVALGVTFMGLRKRIN